MRKCDYVREARNCTAGSPSPFATGDYGCEWPTGSAQCAAPRECQNCTNLSGYGGSSVGIAAALCAPTNVRAVLQADLLATDAFHAPARPTFLVFNPHVETVSVDVAVPGCGIVHWATTPAEAPAPAAGRGGACSVVDADSGAVLASGVAAPGVAAIDVPPGSARVIVCVPDGPGAAL